MLNSDSTDTGSPAAEIEPIAQPQQTNVNWLALPTDIWWHVWPHLSLKDKARLLQVTHFFNTTFWVELARNALQENCIQEVILADTNDASFFIYPEGRVRACGLNSLQQFGKNQAQNVSVPTLLAQRYKQIIANDEDTIFLTSDGKTHSCAFQHLAKSLNENIYSILRIFPVKKGAFILADEGSVWGLGHNIMGCLGQGAMGLTPALIPNLSAIQQIEANYHRALFINNIGQAWEWGANNRGDPNVLTQVLGLPPIKQALTHNKSTFCLDMQGQIWRYMSGDSLQSNDPNFPAREPNLPPIRQMAVSPQCGGSVSSLFLIGIDGKVWALGSNEYSQLGAGDNNSRSVFTLIPNLPPIQQIVAGEDYTYFLDIHGKVWVCGNRLKNQFGLVDNDPNIPTMIPNLPPIKKIVANMLITAFIDISDQVWMYGNNDSGQLGLGHSHPVVSPCLLATSSQKTIIPKLSIDVLVELACDNASHGKLCYEAIIERLKSEKNLNRIIQFVLRLENSPWKQPQLHAELLAPLLKRNLSAFSLVMNADDSSNKNIPASSFIVFEALIELYNYVISNAKLSECQNNLFNLLTKISQGEIDTVDKLVECCPKTGKAPLSEASKKFGVLPDLKSQLTNRYNQLMQKIVNSLSRQPEIFEHLRAAALHLQYRKYAAEQRMFTARVSKINTNL